MPRGHLWVSQSDFKQIFKLRVKLVYQQQIYRDLLVSGDTTLDELAGLILKSFNFDNDHCYGFYSNFESYHDSEEAYEIFIDFAEEAGDPFGRVVEGAKKVGTAKVNKVFQPQKKMLFLFDYGDKWEFEIECLEQTEQEKAKAVLKITNRQGKAPKQYS